MAKAKNVEVTDEIEEFNLEPNTELKHYKNSFMKSSKYSKYREISDILPHLR